ncbi:protein prune homolog 2-like isoform X1 [Xyrichtys novacula]|nr:protein prune homolog 2-like isoform X1 [Xyrichtys novacula]
MESGKGEQEDDSNRSPPADVSITNSTSITDPITTAVTGTAPADDVTTTAITIPAGSPDYHSEEEEDRGKLLEENCVTPAAAGADKTEEKDKADGEEEEKASSGDQEEEEGGPQPEGDFEPGSVEENLVPEQNLSTPTRERPAPPTSLALSGSRPRKKKVLTAPALSLSLGRSESTVSDDFPSPFLSPSPDDGDDDVGLDFDLDAIETPSDSESLHFPIYDLDLEDDLRRLGVASHRHRVPGSGLESRSDSRTGSRSEMEHTDLGALEREDMVDSEGTRWRCFSTGEPPQESRVNMSVLGPFLKVLSHGGYYGDGMNDIIVFSSCYLPENSLENYQYVMDNLFRYVVGTLELMVAENYVIVYLCAGGQKDKLPGISWLKECYTTIDRRLRKNLKGFFVVHPTWYIKALITIIKPFISSKFSRKLQFVDTLQDLSNHVPTENVQIPDCVSQYDQSLSR